MIIRTYTFPISLYSIWDFNCVGPLSLSCENHLPLVGLWQTHDNRPSSTILLLSSSHMHQRFRGYPFYPDPLSFRLAYLKFHPVWVSLRGVFLPQAPKNTDDRPLIDGGFSRLSATRNGRLPWDFAHRRRWWLFHGTERNGTERNHGLKYGMELVLRNAVFWAVLLQKR